ncbi:hypothetical protein GMES_4269 [Paraglaciecola mesophila KMM 241]|uniref:Uncharacterized protein n=1 Tax=Paraglaciecola mesophila KMM 241 TaxID=1128912 RepID=K6ZT99_9ALTE|nr:hypothetical protein GMES_4269 [Paraglaciecola mesophila KMM 241]
MPALLFITISSEIENNSKHLPTKNLSVVKLCRRNLLSKALEQNSLF